MNINKGLSLALAATAVGMTGYAMDLERKLREQKKAHLNTIEALSYTAKLIDKHDVPIDKFDVIAIRTLMHK